MQEFKIKISRLMKVWEDTTYTINAETEEQAKQLALDDELNAKTPEDVGILQAEGAFNYSTLVPITAEENYWLTEKEFGCNWESNPEDIKYETTEIQVL